MAYEFKLPNLGENIEAADITSILVAEGDSVSADQPIIEVETDKASLEVPIDRAGKITSIKVSEGDKIAVGDIILELAEEEEAGDTTEKKAKAAEDEAEEAAKPEDADEVAADAKAADEPADTKDDEKSPEEPQTEEKQPAIAEASAQDTTTLSEPPPASSGSSAPAAPSVRRFAREIGIDIAKVRGTGPSGRISTEDVKAYAKELNSARGARSTVQGAIAVPDLPNFAQFGAIDVEPMSNVRRKTAQHMTLCWQTIPHVTQFDTCDITELERMRKQYGARAEAAGGKLTVTAIILKVMASAIRKFPRFASSLDVPGEKIIYKKYCNIGVAVDTDRGLIVPVIRDVDKKNIVELSAELAAIAARARDRKITMEEMQGGCITLTNLGGIGGTSFTPIVNWPEVAIVGIARGRMEPVWQDGEFVPRLMLPLALSYDHRVIDGADGARFLRWVAEALENPFLMPLEG